MVLHRRHEQHIGGITFELEVFAGPLTEHTGRKRTESFPELDLQVHLRLHPGTAGVSQDTARPKRAGPVLHPAVEPADHLLVG